jgi:hypothetical protein
VLHYFYIVAVLVCIPCLGYLLLTSMEREGFFLTRYLAKLLFPRLERHERHKKMEVIAGLLLAAFLTSVAIAFVINRFGR